MQRDCPLKKGQGAEAGRDKENGSKKGRCGREKGKGPDPLRTPPKPGEAHVKEFKGKMLKWCITCPKWGDHDNEMHRAMIAAACNKDETKQTQKEMNTTATTGGAGGSVFGGLVSHF